MVAQQRLVALLCIHCIVFINYRCSVCGVSMSFWARVAAFFSFDGVANSALKLFDKIAGTDWTPQQRADWILKYHEATKHQSPARRFIAVAFTVGMALFGFTYLASGCIAQLYVFIASNGDTLAELAASQNIAEIRVKPLLKLQNDTYVYMKDVLSNPMTWILGFYFAIDVGSKFKK